MSRWISRTASTPDPRAELAQVFPDAIGAVRVWKILRRDTVQELANDHLCLVLAGDLLLAGGCYVFDEHRFFSGCVIYRRHVQLAAH